MTPDIERDARAAYNAASGNKEDDGWWEQFSEGEREEWRRAVIAVLSACKEALEETVQIALNTQLTTQSARPKDDIAPASAPNLNDPSQW